MGAKDDILNGGKKKKKKVSSSSSQPQANAAAGGGGHVAETKEVTLPNLNVRGKNKRKPLTLDVKPASPGPLQDKIDESKMPDMNLDIDLDNIEVVAKDKSKPLKLDIPAAEQPKVDTGKIERDVPLRVSTPEKIKRAHERLKMAGIDGNEDAKKTPSLTGKIEANMPSLVVPQSVKDKVHAEHAVKQGEAARAEALARAREEAARFMNNKGADLNNIGVSRVTPVDAYRMEHEYRVTPSNEINYHDAGADTAEQARPIKEEASKGEEEKTATPIIEHENSTLEAEPGTEKKTSTGIDPSQWQVEPKDGDTGTVKTDRAKATIEKSETPENKTGQASFPQANSVGSMMALVDEYAKKMEPTKEQLEKERRRRKAAAIFAALGDGVSAWANLQATVGGAPNAKQSTNLSTIMQERYEKLRKEREEKAKEIMAYRMRAHESDRQQANADRSFAEGVRRYDTSLENTKKQQAQQQQNWETTRQDGIDQRNQAQENWQKTFDANEAHRQSQTEIQKTNAETARKNAETAQKRVEAYDTRRKEQQASTLRGKKIGFSDGDKNEVAIYENVWKGSKQNVYNAILDDGIKPSSIEQFEMNTPAKVDEWIKKNWTKSPKARAIMLALSSVDPAAVLSQVESADDESFEEYAETGDDFEQYVEE